MSKIVNRNSSVQFNVAINDKLAVFSKEAFKVYQKNVSTHHPDEWSVVQYVGSGEEYVSTIFTVETTVRIEAKNAPVYYNTGVSAHVTARKGERSQGTAGVLNATGALTAEMMLSGIVTSTTASAVAGTMPIGTVMNAAIDLEDGESFDWSVIVTGATNTFTVTGATGHTLIGAGAVVKSSSGLFRTRKSELNTFITYRIG